MRTLIIHIGSHKTGTTAIQKTLLENRQYLLECGFSYPDVGFDYYGHHALQKALEQEDKALIGEMAEALNDLDANVILSSENFSLSSLAAVELLSNSLNASSVKIIYYQRNILDISFVWWQELIKHGFEKTFLEYYANCMTRPFAQHLLNPKMILDKWGKVFGRNAIDIYLYDKISDTPTHFFESVLHLLRYKAIPESIGINKSFDVPSTELIRCLNIKGHRGVDLVMNDPIARDIRREIALASREKMSSLEVDLDCFIFNTIERDIKRSWGDRIENISSGEMLFVKRSTRLKFIDSSFWLTEPELSAKINRYPF